MNADLQTQHVDLNSSHSEPDLALGGAVASRSQSTASNQEEHSVDDLLVCHPDPDLIVGGQTNLSSATYVNVELKYGMTDDQNPVMDRDGVTKLISSVPLFS